jgi:diguanylate cyclase (GGDEF)-like protein
MGDTLLKDAADAVKKAAPKSAFIARVGGDEFLLLISKGDAGMAERFIEDAQELLAQTEDRDFGVPNISFGYSVMTSASQSYNEVFSEADKMMYQAKKDKLVLSSSGLLPEQKYRDQRLQTVSEIQDQAQGEL